MVIWTSLMPPNPSTSLRKKETANTGEGGNILGLLRTYERVQKQEKEEDDSVSNQLDSLESEIICNLQSMQAEFLRRGLLKGDIERAEEFISKAEKKIIDGSANNSNSGQQHGGGKRRKRGGASGNRSGGIFNSQDIVNTDSGSSIGDEILVMSALNRVLGGGISSSKENTSSIFPCNIVKAAADVLLSISHFINSNLQMTSACIQVEQELIIGMHSQMLNGIANLMCNILEEIEQESIEIDMPNNEDNEGKVEALSSCCKASAKIVSIVGTRLSRSAKLIEKLKSAGRLLLFHNNTNASAMASAAALLATLPLVGNMDGISPQKLWSSLIQEETKSLCAILNIFFPLQRSGSKYSIAERDQAWIRFVKEDVTSQTDRLVNFQRRVEGTILLLLSLLNFDVYNSKTQAAMATVVVPMNELMDLSEFMLAFPSAVETKYFSTKSRLRDLSVDNGLLSPNAAMMVANLVRYYGHELFDSCVTSLQSNSLLYGKRIMRVAFASLHSCSSSVVKKTVDPSSVEKYHEGKKRKWLQGSIELRIKAMKTIKTMIQSIGSNIVINQTTIVHKTLKLVVGCLFEQTESQGFIHFSKNDWGSMKDRVLLTEICIDVLATFVAVCIGFLSSPSRSLIDSVAMACFDKILGNNSSSLITFATVKTALLKLGTNCICAPYADGTANKLISMVHEVSSSLRFDRNPQVVSAAYSTLCVCNALVAQRAPPLVITTPISVSNEMDGFSTRQTELASSEEFIDALKSTISDTMKKEISERKRRNTDDSGKERDAHYQNDQKRQKITGQVTSKKLVEIEKEEIIEKANEPEINRAKISANDNQINPRPLRNTEQKSDTFIEVVDKITPDEVTDQLSDEKTADTEKKNSSNEYLALSDEKGNMGGSSSDDDMSEDAFPEIVDCDPDE